jgi:predicted metal-dependent hydrolase
MPSLLARARALADRGLYFEVHELLEPAWFRAEGDERVALQGLIQVAVAFHHLAQDNRQGAVSLLQEGIDRLGAAGSALPLRVDDWLRELRATLAAFRAGGATPPPVAWPAVRAGSSLAGRPGRSAGTDR